jgi:endo-1,4-beta-mannosidase
MAWWRAFDAGEADRDLARMREWGLDQARIFLTWEDFQPAPDRVADEPLRHLEAVLESAARRGIGLVVTLFCGHMSGVNWLPAWVLAEGATSPCPVVSSGRWMPADAAGAGDVYADPRLLEAQLFLARQLAGRFGTHPALAAWDLGNEISIVRWPASPEDGARWSTLLTAELARDGTAVTGGLHSADLEQDRRIRPSTIAAPWAFAVMHGYPIYSPAAAGPIDPDWVPFLCGTVARLTGKPTICHEFGLPDHELGEEAVGRYAAAVLERLWAEGRSGGFWWCYTDYDPRLASTPPFDRAPHELHFGMLRSDGSEKAVVDAFRAFGRREVRPSVLPPGPDEEALYAGLPASLTEAYHRHRQGL